MIKQRKITDITSIVVHCSDTPKGKHFTAKDIDLWHKERGWTKIGYHFVVLLDGKIEIGRGILEVGAHAEGYNQNSIGVCYIGGAKGEDTRTDAQKKALLDLIKDLKAKYPSIKQVLGHRDTGSPKACPSFDAKTEYKNV